jgi:alpha-glucosidase
MACQSLALAVNASPNPAETDLVVGDGIGEFRPAGYDPAKTPSLALVAEPAPVATTGPAPLPEIRPSFGVEKGAQAVDPAVNFFPAAADLATAVVTAPAGTSFYGTGEVTGPLLRNNTTIRLWNKDNYNWQGDDGKRLYQSHPWVLAVRPDGSAFGVIFDTTWKSQLTCGDHDIKFESQGPPFRVFVIDRASPEAVLRGLAGLIGTIPLPPRWALGFQQCRYSYYPDARVRQIADGFRSRHIPCDVIWMDIDYMRGFRIFTFDPQGFPDPAATNQYLHEKGFHSIWMIDPGVKAEPGYSVYDSGTRENAWVKTADGKEYHGKVWPGECAFPDFTSPGVRAWWGGLYKDFMAKGVDGVWNDMNEPSVFGGPDGSMPESNLHAGGGLLPPGPHLEYHNVYGRLMVEASRAGIQKANPGKRVFVLTRSNFLGGQRYAATWTGDNNAGWYWLKSSIPMSLNLGLSGQPFSGPDIGGYSGVSSPDLFGQWMGLGAFYPFSRAHKSKGEPSSEPWEFGPAVEAASRTATDRRYRLMPYLYTLFRQSSQTGLPVMRPLFMADTKDLSLRGEDQAFTLGGDLLVIPRWAKNPHLPQGDWRAIHVVDPKAEEDAYQPTLRIRPGAIIPMGPIIENTNQYSLKLLTLLVSLDASGHAEGWLYDDAGDGFGFQKGDYSLIHYIATRTGETVTVKIADSQGSLPAEHANVTVQIVTGDYKTDTTQGDDARGIDCTLN